MIFIKKELKRGVSLYIAIMIMAILLAMALGISAILISQMKMVREIDNSVVAFYAADSGIERVLEIIMHDESNLASNYESGGEFTDPNTSYSVNVYRCLSSDPDCTAIALNPIEDPTCSAKRYCVRSTGNFQEIKGAIEVDVDYAQ